MQISRKNNFDLIRLLAALIVLIGHTGYVSQNEAFLDFSRIFSSKVAVDSFFIISGFLIFRSFENSSSLGSYIKKRVKRIVPGYAAVIIISAFALYFVSSVSFTEYFNLEFVKYIVFNLTTLNFLQPDLPGVFETHPVPMVNTSLWTIKVEVMFYIVVPFIAYILRKTNKVWAIAAIYLSSILYSTVIVQLVERLNSPSLMILEHQLPGQLAFFMSGALLYYFYDQFHHHAHTFLAIAALIITVHNFATEIYFLYPIALGVVVIYFCLIFKYLGNFSKHGDFSYGIYIWHLPIMQVIYHFNLFEQPWLGALLSYLCVFLVSYISWNYIEKPFLTRQNHYVVAQTQQSTRDRVKEQVES
ncbi:MAG: acyltransferase [Cyanobacteria bacterium P01_G01_bin.67]